MFQTWWCCEDEAQIAVEKSGCWRCQECAESARESCRLPEGPRGEGYPNPLALKWCCQELWVLNMERQSLVFAPLGSRASLLCPVPLFCSGNVICNFKYYRFTGTHSACLPMVSEETMGWGLWNSVRTVKTGSWTACICIMRCFLGIKAECYSWNIKCPLWGRVFELLVSSVVWEPCGNLRAGPTWLL